MARNNVQTTVTVGMDVRLAKRNAEALKSIIADLNAQLKIAREAMDNPTSAKAFEEASRKVDELTLKIRTLKKVQSSATPATAYESFISGDPMNSNTLRQAQRGAKNRLNTVRYGEGDQEARQFINDIDTIQKQTNRLQAGFTSPFRTIRQELKNLTGGELQRLLTLLQQEQKLVQGNDKAWANYAEAIAKVEQRMREYDTVAKQQVGAKTLATSQSGGFSQANERDIQRAIEKLKEYRAVINDPNGTGKATWEATTREITKLQAALDTLKQKTAEMNGESMSFSNAYSIGLKGFYGQFRGTTQQLTQAKKRLEEQLMLTERGTREYKKLQKAIQGCEMEEKRMGMSTKEIQAILDKPKGKSFNELKIAVEQGRMELARMRTETVEDKKRFDELAAKVKECDYQMKQLAGSSKGTATSFDKAWSRLKTYVTLYMGAAVAIQKITATMGDMLELSDKLGEVRKTTGFTADEVGRLSDELKKLDTRTTITGLLDLSVAAGQLGLKTQEDVEGFTIAANKLMVALPEMGKEGATEMLKVALATGEIDKIRKQMEQGLIDGSSATAVAMEKVGSTIDRLRATSAATAPAITDFVKRVGAVGAQSGISIDQVAALGSTVDALGMRVEMSATALSRMIPAIKNNAFDVAKAIGMVPEELRAMFDEAGGGMNAMIAIFEHIRDAGMSPDDIEKMLGMGGMQEVMEELNQQGARAGIVFAGLSQNVDELRRQLGVAAKAYEENIAIEAEYQKMNETTAAKWERLKNQIEEWFVGDTTQRWLGWIIDRLRAIVDLLTGDKGISIAIRSLIGYVVLLKARIAELVVGSLKALWTGIMNIGKAIGFVKGEMKALQMSNIFTALVAVIWYAVDAFNNLKKSGEKLNEVLGEISKKISTAVHEANDMFIQFNNLTKKQNELTESAKSLKEREGKLKEELEKLRKKLGEGAEKSEVFKNKQKELEQAHKDVAKAEGDATNATNQRLGVINEINSKYSTYLGYMLSEASTAETVASAHDLITSALKEEMYWREKNNAFKTVSEKYSEDLNEYIEDSLDELSDIKGDPARQQKIMNAWQSYISEVTYDALKGGFTLTPGGKTYGSVDAALEAMKGRFHTMLVSENGYYMVHTDDQKDRLEDWWGGGTDDGFKDWTRVSLQIIKETAMLQGMMGSAAETAHEETVRKVENNTNALIEQAQKRGEGGEIDNKQLAEAIVGIHKNLSKYEELGTKFSQFEGDNTLENISNVLMKDIPEETRKTIMEEVQRVSALNGGTVIVEPVKPWGTTQPAESTAYDKMNAEQLVARRKQMKDFVNAIQSDTDIETVLGEDAALKKAIQNGLSKDFRSVVEWYNTERLKIQDELYSRHLTNTGDWKDPKKGAGSWRKQLQNDFDTYLKILDAYYTERKAMIEKAQSEEGMSEAEAQRLTIENETVWRKHRMELQKIYLGKGAEIAEEERKRIYDILAEQDEEDAGFIEKTIARSIAKMTELEQKGEQGLVEYRKIESKLIKDIATDMYKQQNAVAKQVEAIEKIIAQERPFDGLTKNLSDNLSTMGILFADLNKKRQDALAAGKQPEDDTYLRGVKQTNERMLVLMQQAEDAYTLTFDKLKEVMVKEGFKDWAYTIENDDQMRKAMMAMLRKMYDDVHAAIKKESSQMKKELDIWWNDVEGEGEVSRKGGFEKMLSDLGLKEDQVKRANSLIGAGAASERVADKLAIQQMRVRLAMQNAYYAKMKEIGNLRIKQLEAEERQARKRGETGKADLLALDAKHARQALNLSLSEEQNKVLEQEVAIQNQLEESQNRLYTELREWGDLLASSLKEVFEASHAGEEEYYNSLAMYNLTGKGGPGAGAYIVTENAGKEGATAHYEYLTELEAIERQREIERQNAQAEAWKKVMDDLNAKMNEQITDWMNAYLQNQSIDANTAVVDANTLAIKGLTEQLAQGLSVNISTNSGGELPAETPADNGFASDKQAYYGKVSGQNATPDTPTSFESSGDFATDRAAYFAAASGATDPMAVAQVQMDANDAVTQNVIDNKQKQVQTEVQGNQKIQKSNASTFAKMTMAANMYGIAYQAMSNDNLSTTQKFEMMALQAVGNYAIGALTTEMAAASAKATTDSPGVLGTLWKQLGWAAAPVFAIFTGLLGGLMGLATSKIGKAKSQIAQATGASGASAGKLTTGMKTYAEGNVNEFTDPSSLTAGRQYNVDGADGKTYRARYMGKGAKTHLTNGPEFHLVGEAGREAIIDAHTTRQITMDEPEIWHTIQTLYNGGSLRHIRRRGVGRGVRAFADGNLDDFSSMDNGEWTMDNGGGMDLTAMQASLDRNSAVQEALLERLREPIVAQNILYGPDGLPNVIAKLQKEAARHGEKYL